MASPRPVVKSTTNNTTNRTATLEPAGMSPESAHDTSNLSMRPATRPPTRVHPNDFMRPTMAATSESNSNFGPKAVCTVPMEPP